MERDAKVVQIDDLRDRATLSRRRSGVVCTLPTSPVLARFWSPMLKEDRTGRRHRHLPPGGTTVHRQADRAGAELRRAGRHRHREHPAAQRAAQRTDDLIAGAADRDLGGAQGHLQLAGRTGAGIRGHAGERHADLRGQIRQLVALRRRVFHRAAAHRHPSLSC